ncbi:MAG: ribonuclease HII, partial [Bacteroidota bacterium]
GIPIYQYPDPQLFITAFSPLIKNTPVKFYAFTGNVVLFSNTMASLQNIIANHQNQTTLSYSETFKDMTSGLNQNASVTMVGLHPGFTTTLQKNIAEHYKKDIEAINLKNYPYFAFQAIADRNFVHIAAMVKKTTVKNKGNTIAQLLSIILDADVASPPQFVTNHRTKQKEILVQDIENTLYLISNTGKVLWKKKLDSRIQGHVQQVDLYKNGRLQLAFATQRKLNIIDRNGNEVAPFPITIADNITQPLAVFDYDRNKDYRFLVCHGKKLSMYDNRGNIVSGFTRTQIQSNVVSSPKHFRIGTKDYLTIPEENGKLHILHRNGNTRIDVNRNINFSANPVYLYNNYFTVTNKEGRLVQIDEKGGISIRNLNLDQNHSITTTAKTLITLSDNVLTIKDKKVTLDFGTYTAPQIFRINNKSYIALTDTQTNKIYMYDSNAVLLPNFPVYGMAAIDLDDIDNDNALELTVQGDKNVILLYKIN